MLIVTDSVRDDFKSVVDQMTDLFNEGSFVHASANMASSLARDLGAYDDAIKAQKIAAKTFRKLETVQQIASKFRQAMQMERISATFLNDVMTQLVIAMEEIDRDRSSIH